MTETPAIRRAVPDDLVSIIAIERQCFADAWNEESMAAALSLPHMRSWVAERGEASAHAIVGYVIALMLGAEAEVADLAVAPPVRGQGIGGALLDHLLADMVSEGVEVVFLEVRESNVAARGLYASRDFSEVGRRSAYYRHPVEDALLLRRDLVPA